MSTTHWMVCPSNESVFIKFKSILRIMSCVESQPVSELLFEAVCLHMLLDQVDVVVDFLVHSLALLLGRHSLVTGF